MKPIVSIDREFSLSKPSDLTKMSSGIHGCIFNVASEIKAKVKLDSQLGHLCHKIAFSFAEDIYEILKNSIDACLKSKGFPFTAIINLSFYTDPGAESLVLISQDNGSGFPKEYLTAKEIKGKSSKTEETALGGQGEGMYALQNKLHSWKARMTKENPETGGAKLTLVFPIAELIAREEAEQKQKEMRNIQMESASTPESTEEEEAPKRRRLRVRDQEDAESEIVDPVEDILTAQLADSILGTPIVSPLVRSLSNLLGTKLENSPTALQSSIQQETQTNPTLS